jgi:hypothetical protein
MTFGGHPYLGHWLALLLCAAVCAWGWKIAYPSVTVRLEFKSEDCWIGAFWKTTYDEMRAPGREWRTDLWICLLPMLPLHLAWSANR